MKLREIVIFRHAQKASWAADPDLSSEGLRQAREIVHLVQKGTLPKPELLLSSPRRRAQQTLTPVQEHFQIPLLLRPALNERESSENAKRFEDRIKIFLHQELPQERSTCIFLCTHLDWLEVFSWAAPLNEDIGQEIFGMPPAHFYHIELETDPSSPWKILRKGSVQ